ncbi:MAG: LysR family transcriptional regulator [Hydrogenophaga sp.]|jgi:DNA-binding transcriptional LysR family regulator|uniref:LysR family transcriptional regulator n=1 Tax=Hydrogenophaga TaxID=47420 RepID=UPI0008D7DC70|nr:MULTISPECIES: LysR family transcriptional regulator [Hydrogenophaga]MBU4184341.1 LysR family transcriptional regulator [Gammaproteobacteria bacterium]OGB36334.1 MAG: LysR family transcriptional regulator [Burkholderiales bacterium RIFCSPLOWO2_02_FULL_66_35]PKO75045.1 MAG: LysR family transcriptional regulator [Betaproteobacteria bacterium HGW-Betaproteobacteria-15]MBU4279281.1 LysR family transcriptional regulator [Gammaproteobacteria bacterium]MBU4322111.1 LysR family transcriptional regul
MKYVSMFDKIDLHLIRVLYTVLTERSVSRAALRLGMYQPAVSASLKRLRELAGDPLLVRSGSGMVPTVAGLRMIEPAADILRSAEVLFSDARSFDPATAHHTFSLAASDYLDPLFLPQLVAQIKSLAPQCPIEIHPLSADSDYRHHLAQGDFDVVIGNWPLPPGDLHLGRLFGDEVVCLVSNQHPAVRRGWDVEAWLSAEHIAPTPTHPGARGVIDDHLAAKGLVRNITARCPHFGLIPAMVAGSLLVLTTGRQYCERYTGVLPVQVLPCPVEFPRMMYYQLWHERTHASSAGRWLREQIKGVAAALRRPEADAAAA